MDTTKPDDGTKFVLSDRKRRAQELREEMRLLSKYKKRLKARLKDGLDWPMDAATGDRADIDHEDVMAPLPEDMKAPLGDVDEKMQKLRAEADQYVDLSDVVSIDEGVLSRRRREREEDTAAIERVRGERWTVELVDARLEEAYRTLFRSSISGMGPRPFGNAMPEVVRQMSDLVHQAGNKSLRNAIAHRFKNGVPSTDEVRRADDALSWGLSYLSEEHADLAGFLQLGAMWRAWGAKITKKCADHGIQRQVFYRDRKEALTLIVEGLKRDGKAPT